MIISNNICNSSHKVYIYIYIYEKYIFQKGLNAKILEIESILIDLVRGIRKNNS